MSIKATKMSEKRTKTSEKATKTLKKSVDPGGQHKSYICIEIGIWWSFRLCMVSGSCFTQQGSILTFCILHNLAMYSSKMSMDSSLSINQLDYYQAGLESEPGNFFCLLFLISISLSLSSLFPVISLLLSNKKCPTTLIKNPSAGT